MGVRAFFGLQQRVAGRAERLGETGGVFLNPLVGEHDIALIADHARRAPAMRLAGEREGKCEIKFLAADHGDGCRTIHENPTALLAECVETGLHCGGERHGLAEDDQRADIRQ